MNVEELKIGDILLNINKTEKRRRFKLERIIEKSYGLDYHFSNESEYMENDFNGGSLILVKDQIIQHFIVWIAGKNFEDRKGWENRNIKPLPTEKCIIFIIKNDVDGESIHLCKWKPYNYEEHLQIRKPSEVYLGSAKTIDRNINIGFSIWNQNNDEFIYYKVVEYPKL